MGMVRPKTMYGRAFMSVQNPIEIYFLYLYKYYERTTRMRTKMLNRRFIEYIFQRNFEYVFKFRVLHIASSL